nr:DUF1524 domain-containing protein [Salinivibrio sp. EAGSL]
MYSQHSIELTKAQDNDTVQRVLTSLKRKLDEKLPSYSEFEVRFLDLNYLSNKTKSKNVIKYSLCKLLGSQSNGLDINHINLTIEHIIPESMIKSGSDPLIIGSVGNLLLTDASTNGHKLKDNLPADKIAILNESGYPLETNFIYGYDWSEEKVFERAKKISKHVYNEV